MRERYHEIIKIFNKSLNWKVMIIFKKVELNFGSVEGR